MARGVMMASGLLLAILGLGCLLLPEAVAAGLGLPEGAAEALPLAAGGLLGFAGLDWMGRGAIYGGIYGKPIVLGNFTIGAMTTLTMIPLVVASPSLLGGVLLAAFLGHWAVFTRLLYGPPFEERRGRG